MSDLDHLEKNLKSLVSQDKSYKLKNAAKFRAVEQKVPTFDQFEEIVNASHLKPLDKKENIQNMSYNRWNPDTTREDFYDGSEKTFSKLEVSGLKNRGSASKNTSSPTQKYSSFDKTLSIWKNTKSNQEKINLLKNSENFSIQNEEFFKKVLQRDTDFLEELVICCGEMGGGDRLMVINLLKFLSKTSNFDVSVSFFDDDDNCDILKKYLES